MNISDTLLAGSRVLDLTEDGQMLCGKLLGDLGADVIKIEPPGGSISRKRPPYYHDIADPEKSLEWFYLGINKRSVTLSLESQTGRDILKRLAAGADFVIESFAPAHMAGLGLGYPDLERINPRIILCSITPFGQTGPYSAYKSPDLVGVSLGGMVRMFGETDGPPTRISTPLFHQLGALHGALGCMMAHYHRELHGEGQHVDVSCQQAVVLALNNTTEMWDIAGLNLRGTGPSRVWPRAETDELLSLRLVYACKDGYIVAMLHPGRTTQTLISIANGDGFALELADYAQEDADTGTLLLEQSEKLYESMGRFFLTKTKAELLDIAVADDLLMIPVNTVAEVAASPQFAFRQYWRQITHTDLDDTLTYPGWPVRWTDMPPYEPQRRAPHVGEHNTEVFQAELGFSDTDIASLKEQGVI